MRVQIEGMLSVRKLEKNEVLFQKGDEGDGLYSVISGAIRISSLSSGGKEASFNIMRPGDVFGEIALLDGRERTADAMAIESSTLSFLQRAKFKLLLASEPEFALRLTGILCNRIRRMSSLIEDFLLLDIGARLARQLVLACGDEDSATVQLSQENLAQFLGTSRVTVNKHLQEWQKQGWIALGRSKVRILDRSALEEVIEARLDGFDRGPFA